MRDEAFRTDTQYAYLVRLEGLHITILYCCFVHLGMVGGAVNT